MRIAWSSIEPQIKRGTLMEDMERHTVWRLYYFTGERWKICNTWTCNTKREACYFAFTHQWLRICGHTAGMRDHDIGRLIADSLILSDPWQCVPARRGGARSGAGRKPRAGMRQTERINLPMTEAERAEIEAAVPATDTTGRWIVDAALMRARGDE